MIYSFKKEYLLRQDEEEDSFLQSADHYKDDIAAAQVLAGKEESGHVIRSISDVVKNSRVGRLFAREFSFRNGYM